MMEYEVVIDMSMYPNSSNQRIPYFKKKYIFMLNHLIKKTYSCESIVFRCKYREQGKLSLNSIRSVSIIFNF